MAQVRTSAQELIRLAKRRGFSVLLVGHVTKEGLIAGPRVLEHMVDTVLYFEGERYYSHRVVRTVKNRLHLDLQVSGGRHLPAELRGERLAAEARRLCALGARVVEEHLSPGSPHVDHLWMADPEGNECCVLRSEPELVG